jgi:Flp pilus assembly pilin Flp
MKLPCRYLEKRGSGLSHDSADSNCRGVQVRGVFRLGRQLGQGMTEYIIIVALIAVAAIGIYTLFGQTIRNQTAGLALEMSGQDAASAIASAQTNATTAQTNANVRKGLDNFNASNRP